MKKFAVVISNSRRVLNFLIWDQSWEFFEEKIEFTASKFENFSNQKSLTNEPIGSRKFYWHNWKAILSVECFLFCRRAAHKFPSETPYPEMFYEFFYLHTHGDADLLELEANNKLLFPSWCNWCQMTKALCCTPENLLCFLVCGDNTSSGIS